MQSGAFPNYVQLKPVIPSVVWWLLRGLTLGLTLFVILLLFIDPDIGLVIFWQLLIPLLPLSFAVFPGLWRNICPMAFLNQLPRHLGISRELTLKESWRRPALYISVIGFLGFVLLRHPLLNKGSYYLGAILLVALIFAFVGGLIFKGRSGWCGTFCPLAPLQKAYGHAPLVLIRNGYCETCLGCQKNCYDFNPRAAFFSDLKDSDPEWSEQRKFFIAFLPGLIVGYFNSGYVPESGMIVYLQSMLYPAVISTGIFYIFHNTLHINYFKLASIFTMAALGIFYWNGISVVNNGLNQLLDWSLSPGLVSISQYAVLLICLAVAGRSFVSEQQIMQSKQSSSRGALGKEGVEVLKTALSQTARMASVTELSSGMQLTVPLGQTLLEAIEANELPIMSGCRMGMCGSDPIVIVEGFDNLDPPDENEINTLRRLGLEGKARLACCCRPKAKVTFDLEADPTKYTALPGESNDQQSNIKTDRPRIVIVGNGIAGISVAETLRDKQVDFDIVMVSDEPYHFYNRMGLESVIHGRIAMQGLYLVKEDWYQLNRVDTWLNTTVTSIDPQNKQITLGTGELVDYHKLVLATGAKAFIPDAPCYQLPGVFTLRNAEDAITIRRTIQQSGIKHAIVLGGGVLGVEAAEALSHIGIKVTILHIAEYLMNRQIDRHAGVILKTFLSNKGIRVVTGTGIETITESGDLKEVLLEDGRKLIVGMILLCIGVRPNTQLAEKAGLDINRGILVDNQMRTSDKDIFCVGDAAELPDALGGLWSIGNEQGKIAADIIAEGDSSYAVQASPPVQLKVSGIDLKSFGSFGDSVDVESVTDGDASKYSWRHLKIKNGQLLGGVFVNSPLAAVAAINKSKIGNQKLSKQEIAEIIHKDD